MRNALEVEAKRHLNLARAADRMRDDSQTAGAVVKAGIGL
jgi:hypothetical protein